MLFVVSGLLFILIIIIIFCYYYYQYYHYYNYYFDPEFDHFIKNYSYSYFVLILIIPTGHCCWRIGFIHIVLNYVLHAAMLPTAHAHLHPACRIIVITITFAIV